MRFVLGNRLLDRAGGTEVHLVTIGEELQRLGHEVWLYSPELGSFSDEAQRRGLAIAGTVEALPAQCDVVLAQDTIVSYDLGERFPGALTIFRICGDVVDFQTPPQVPDLVDLVIVLSDRYERTAIGCATRAPILRLQIPIDLHRLVPISVLPEVPRRAVLLGNYLERTDVVEAACAARGIEVARIGGAQQSYNVGTALDGTDIVFAKSRAALDAMACGRAVYVLDIFGGDGWVTPENYGILEADHFAGLATSRVIGPAEIEHDLTLYDAAMGPANRDLIVQHHSPRDHVLALLEAIADRVPAPRPAAPLRELSRLTALNWSWEQISIEHRAGAARAQAQTADDGRLLVARVEAEREDFRQRLRDVEARAEAAERDAAQAHNAHGDLAAVIARTGDPVALRAELEAMRRTRAWRMATWFWQLKARLGPR